METDKIEHQGELLKVLLFGTGIKMENLASVMGMTRQNLNKHLRQEILSETFTSKFFEVFKRELPPLFEYGLNDAKKTWNHDYKFRVLMLVNGIDPQGEEVPGYVPGQVNSDKKEAKDDNPQKPDESHKKSNVDTRNLPPRNTPKRVPVLGEALAGTNMEMNTTDQNLQTDYIDVGDLLKDSEAAFVVYGNSMMPNYPSGCILGIKRNYDGFIQPGEIYLLQTKSNRIFKRLYNNDLRTGYMCYSDNDLVYDGGARKGQLFYPPFEVLYSDVISIFDVTGVIKRTRNSGIMLRQV